jgi:very-short-patch-repair endonuclease
MALLSAHSLAGRPVWEVVRRQDGVIGFWQLVALGYSAEAIQHRIEMGRLHRIHRGVYSVGRAELSPRGRMTAALLACGEGALLSHSTAAAVWGIRTLPAGAIEISLHYPAHARHDGIRAHRRKDLRPADRDVRACLPLTSIATTLLDLATRLSRDSLEAAINAADKHDLIDPDSLRAELDGIPRRPGLARLRSTLDAPTFTLTDSALERRFIPIAGRAGLPKPQTQVTLDGHRVDFFWPELGLVVETDGLRYHRTPAEQARDHVRDQAHAAAGRVPLRFTRAQVRFQPEHVEATLNAVAVRLARRTPRLPS